MPCEYKDPRCATTDECYCGEEPRLPKSKPYKAARLPNEAVIDAAARALELRRQRDVLEQVGLMAPRTPPRGTQARWRLDDQGMWRQVRDIGFDPTRLMQELNGEEEHPDEEV